MCDYDMNDTLNLQLQYPDMLKKIYEESDFSKFKELDERPKGDLHKDYEIKTKNLRLYFFKDEGLGQIIVLGGMKGSQKKDINRMREIKYEYFKNK